MPVKINVTSLAHVMRIEGVYSYWSQSPKLGEGLRLVVVYDRDKKWVRVLGLGTLHTIRVPADAMDGYERLDMSMGRLRRNLKRTSARFDRCNVIYSKQVVRRMMRETTA